MDSWLQEHHPHLVTFHGQMEPLNLTNSIYSTQRTFGEMSQHTTLSPSPFLFSHAAPSPTENPSYSSSYFERRHQSHPHNPAARPGNTFSPSLMTEHFRPSQRSTLERRGSQTIIDLTEETDDGELYLLNPHSVHRPPHLGRSDSSALGDLIDLTEDNGEEDLEITHTRTVSGVLSAPNAPHEHRRRRAQPEIFPRENSPFSMQHPPRHSPRNLDRDILSRPPFGPFGSIRTIRSFGPWGHNSHDHVVFVPAPPERMPDLHYDQHAFGQARQPDVQANPPLYEAPSAAKEGFTRSPTENDIIICPACEQELVARNDEDQTAVKKSKTQNKKDRAEHPFWVVKTCGHVYCNHCFQNRKGDKKQPSPFPDIAKSKHSKRVIECAVEDCHQDVGDKKHWVGVFI